MRETGDKRDKGNFHDPMCFPFERGKLVILLKPRWGPHQTNPLALRLEGGECLLRLDLFPFISCPNPETRGKKVLSRRHVGHQGKTNKKLALLNTLGGLPVRLRKNRTRGFKGKRRVLRNCVSGGSFTKRRRAIIPYAVGRRSKRRRRGVKIHFLEQTSGGVPWLDLLSPGGGGVLKTWSSITRRRLSMGGDK